MSLLKIANEAFEGYKYDQALYDEYMDYMDYMDYMEKSASIYNVPYVQALAGKVSQNTLDIWRKTHNLAKRSATPDMVGYYQHISDAAQKAQGEGKIALEGVQRIIRHIHNVPGPRPVADMNMINNFHSMAQ